MDAAGGRSGRRSSTVMLVLAAAAALSAVAVDVLAWVIANTVRGWGNWVALFLPVVVIDALMVLVGVPRALADHRRAATGGRPRWQPVCALCLFAAAAAAIALALWLFAHRNPQAGLEI